jgi:hypothetical protein
MAMAMAMAGKEKRTIDHSANYKQQGPLLLLLLF